jgi:hypothetical protein
MSSVLGEEKKSVKKLQIGIKKRVENCSVKSRKGDKLSMHYTVSSFYPLTQGSQTRGPPDAFVRPANNSKNDKSIKFNQLSLFLGLFM